MLFDSNIPVFPSRLNAAGTVPKGINSIKRSVLYKDELNPLFPILSNSLKSIYLILSVVLGLIFYLFVSYLIKAFQLDDIKKICETYNLFLMEDNCDAFSSKYGDDFTGTFGDVSTLSFYPAHHITTGEGGAVLYNDYKMKRIVESFRDWGRDCWCQTGMNNTCGKRYSWKLGKLPKGYDHKFVYSHVGYNMKITDIQAALGCSQLDNCLLYTSPSPRDS